MFGTPCGMWKTIRRFGAAEGAATASRLKLNAAGAASPSAAARKNKRRWSWLAARVTRVVEADMEARLSLGTDTSTGARDAQALEPFAVCRVAPRRQGSIQRSLTAKSPQKMRALQGSLPCSLSPRHAHTHPRYVVPARDQDGSKILEPRGTCDGFATPPRVAEPFAGPRPDWGDPFAGPKRCGRSAGRGGEAYPAGSGSGARALCLFETRRSSPWESRVV
jgi:hypothetical protein